MKLLDKWAQLIHVLNTLIQGLECLVILDLLVLRKSWLCLLLHHVLNEGFEIVGVNRVPKLFLPGVKLSIDQGNKIPHLFKGLELILAVFKLLIISSLKIEERLKDLEFLGLVLHL